jgi:hypothetical protein
MGFVASAEIAEDAPPDKKQSTVKNINRVLFMLNISKC